MIYITGDKHGRYSDVMAFCYDNETNKDDMLIILGDAGINYNLDYRDFNLKKTLSCLPITLFCIHGNHEERPENIKTYETMKYHNGIVYFEEKYPNILFAKDAEVYDIDGLDTLVIGGAYSVDKDRRVAMGMKWYPSEQPNELTKENVRNKLKENDYKVDVILSHTCPYKYLPTEMFLPYIDQSKVDKSTEMFLDEIEEKTLYQRWYCGHYHTDKTIDKIQFMMYDIDEFGKKLVKKKRN